jgi:hypothetical protein
MRWIAVIALLAGGCDLVVGEAARESKERARQQEEAQRRALELEKEKEEAEAALRARQGEQLQLRKWMSELERADREIEETLAALEALRDAEERAQLELRIEAARNRRKALAARIDGVKKSITVPSHDAPPPTQPAPKCDPNDPLCGP